MKKIFKLTQNELVKMLKKKSTIILVSILVLISAGIPIISSMSIYEYDDRENYLHRIKWAEEQLLEIKDDDDGSLKIKNEIIHLELEIDMYQTMYDENISYNDWRNDYYLNVIDNRYVSKFLNIIDEKQFPEVAQEFLGHIPEVSNLLQTNYTIDDIKKVAKQYEKKADGYLNNIIDDNFKEYLKEQKFIYENELIDHKEAITNLEIQLKENPDDYEILNSLKSIKQNVISNELNIKLMDAQMKSTDFSNTENRKKYDNMLRFSEEHIYKISRTKLTEDEFNLDYHCKNKYDTYENYVEIFDRNVESEKENFDLLLYAIENNIPDYSSTNSTRYSIFGILGFMLFICIIISVFAGGIVSKEYSTGTIRLLLIRPASRNKILISKLLALLFIAIGLVIISFISISISSIIAYGVEDISYPILSIKDGVISKCNIFIYLIPKILISFSPIIFAISLAFAISTVTKITALSVGLSVAVIGFSMPFTQILMQFNKLNCIVPYLPTTYVYYSDFLQANNSYMMEVLSRLSVNVTAGFGAIVFAVYSAVFLTISFIVFNKRDVLN